MYKWDSADILVPLVVSGVSFVTFLLWEYFLSTRSYNNVQPVFPLRLISSRVFMAAMVYVNPGYFNSIVLKLTSPSVTLLTGSTFIPLILILPEKYQIVNGDNSLMAGIHLLSMLGGCAVGSFVAGAISNRRNNTPCTVFVASFLQLIGVALLSTVSQSLSDLQAQIGYQIIYGLGVGLSFGAVTIMCTAHSLEHGDLAVAQGALAQARVLGGCIGIAGCMAIFNSQVNRSLSQYLSSDEISTLRRSPTASLTLSPDQQVLVRGTYADAFTADMKIMIYICSALCLASCFTWQKRAPPVFPNVNERAGNYMVSEEGVELSNTCAQRF
jgi:hypothetical protein